MKSQPACVCVCVVLCGDTKMKNESNEQTNERTNERMQECGAISLKITQLKPMANIQIHCTVHCYYLADFTA